MGAEEQNPTPSLTSANAAPDRRDYTQDLLDAARYNDFEDMMSFVEGGVSLDCKDREGRTALHMAAANGHHAMVDYILDKGADINVCNSENNTPLHWACLNGHVEVIKSMITRGADVSKLNRHDRTPIDEAVMNGKLEVIDAFNTAVAQAELDGVAISKSID
ncbi:putative Ankyrin repeat-containing protein [Zostera marina]|uniref:Putative Ankyrin repeat-containing protein n=1 Tax=Zostera marina TaxID=29655 RepID=A0A0K9NSA1_ZOSMR|nr:putative Ankyrin repeat-containing protein [Zostera marina]